MVEINDLIIWVGLSGALSVLAILWNGINLIIKRQKRPKLSIELHEEWNGRWVLLNGGRYVKFHCLHVKNLGKSMARECTALLTIINRPPEASTIETEHILHWADIDYSYNTNQPEPTDIGSGSRRLDVFFSQSSNSTVPPQGVNINDIFCSGNPSTICYDSTTGSLTSISPAGSSVRPRQTRSTSASLDSWMAVPIALSNPQISNQEHLPPGRYRIKIKVDCENCKGAEREFTIDITQNGQNNAIGEITRF